MEIKVCLISDKSERNFAVDHDEGYRSTTSDTTPTTPDSTDSTDSYNHVYDEPSTLGDDNSQSNDRHSDKENFEKYLRKADD